MADVSSIIEQYVDLLIIQYSQKPKARALIRLFVEQVLSSGVLLDVRDGYDLETAVGKQLDVLGKYIGIGRFYRKQILENYFALIDFDEVDSPPPEKIGLADYSDFETKEGRMLQFSNILSSTLALNDDDYRFILKLKIIQNYSDHSHQSIDEALYAFFGSDVYVESTGNMQMTYHMPMRLSAVLEVAIQKGVIMRPMGVEVTYVFE